MSERDNSEKAWIDVKNMLSLLKAEIVMENPYLMFWDQMDKLQPKKCFHILRRHFSSGHISPIKTTRRNGGVKSGKRERHDLALEDLKSPHLCVMSAHFRFLV